MAASDAGQTGPDLLTQNQADKVFPGVNPDASSPESGGSRLDPFTDHSIAEALQNVGLEETQSWHGEDKYNDDFGGEGGSDGAKFQYPLRPYAEDCAFYVRTGHCRYRLLCRFNHPVKKRANQLQGAKERNKDELAANTVCKYYHTAAGCKFGEACRYVHQNEQTEKPELNFLGLPLREGEMVCLFYMRNGSCGYGSTCRFHHPEPTDVVGSNSCNSTPTLKSIGGLNGSLSNHNGESDPSQQLGTSQPALASWSSLETVSYLRNNLSFVPMTDSISEEVDATYEWNGSQPVAYPEESPWQMNSPPATDNSVKADVSTYNQQQIQCDEFPQRPGQPDCDYFLKTGNCKYGYACRYNHPKIQFSKSPTSALKHRNTPKPFNPQEKAWEINSALGVDIVKKKTDVAGYHKPKIEVDEFPERPGEPDCTYFMKTGDCKYRSGCKYHHPRNQVSNSNVCALNDKGLPLRPDKQICWHYEHYGICKFGRGCFFDHPVDHCRSPSPLGLEPSLPSSSYTTAFGGTTMPGSGTGSEILISQSV